MWTGEDPLPGVDTDEIQAFQAPLPTRERLVELGAAWVDHAAPELARLCAGWALRNQPVEELVGYLSPCSCAPKVFPRSALSSRFPPGETLDALRRIRMQRGRLAVVATASDHSDYGPLSPSEHHIVLPNVAAPDTAGLLEPLSAEHRTLLDRCIEQHLPRQRSFLVKKLFDHSTPDALYMSADFLEHGGTLHIHRRDLAMPDDPPLLDAADYEAVPGKVLCIVRPQRVWQKSATARTDPDQRFGPRLERDLCHERVYL